MKITNLKLINFRNYSNLNITFSEKKNIIIGDNGEGKTNIVEAIYYLALTKSFKTNNDQILIKNDENFSAIEGHIIDKIENTYRIIINEDNKIIKIDNNIIKRVSDYISKINIILFTESDLKLIKDNPSVHRKLINIELSQFDNDYLKLLSLYNKVLKQRNMYLKSMLVNSMIPKDYLDILTEKIVDLGLKINQKRCNFILAINNYLNDYFEKITGKSGIKIDYISQYNNKTKENLLKEYKQNNFKEINYGKTNIGIHLDDFIFTYDNKLAKEYLSEGEQKNAVISYKLAAIEYCKKEKNKVPILILDDLFSELDKKKINNLLNLLSDDMQIFITTTDVDNVDDNLKKDSKMFYLSNQKITEV